MVESIAIETGRVLGSVFQVGLISGTGWEFRSPVANRRNGMCDRNPIRLLG